MKEISFKTKLDFLKSFLKEPKKMASAVLVGSAVFIGGKKLSAQELSGIRDKSITPIVEAAGHSAHSNTFAIGNADKNSLDFLMKSFEYRYGKDVANKLFSGTYNLGLEVGTNNFMIGNRPISKKAYESILLSMKLSKILKLPVDIRLGYNQKLNQFSLSGVNLQSSVSTKSTATGVSLTFPDGKKFTNYDLIQELKLSKKFTASLRVINQSNIKFKKGYFGLQGSIDLSRKEKIFVPYFGVYGQKGKPAPDVNFGFFLKPNVNGSFSMYTEAGITKGKASAFLRLSKTIGKNPAKKSESKDRNSVFQKIKRRGRR